jgi:hypothetical protein
MHISENYLDPDVAYLLGLITARGTLYESQGDKKVIIEFPYKNLLAEGLKTQYAQKEHLFYSINEIRDRVYELTETDINVIHEGHTVKLILRFLRNSITWRNINHLLKGCKSFHEFEIPEQVFVASNEIKKEFLRGISDCAGFIRQSNNYMGGKRRVYLEIANSNWRLPIQICDLLQRHLLIPVQLIQWGHPNTREPKQTKKRGTTWAREHQIKIFSEAFEPIGFYVGYKHEILSEFATSDKKMKYDFGYCNPNPKIRRKEKKPHHPEEKNKKLPACLRGKHYDSYWQICVDLGCQQKMEVYDPQLSITNEPEETEGG